MGMGVWALCIGTPTLSPIDVFRLARHDDGSIAYVVLTELRLPRLVIAATAGATLGIVGASLQPALQNPLAGPELTGVAAGASLAVATITVLDIGVPTAIVPLAAAGTGFTAGLGILIMTMSVPDPARLALAGAAMAAIVNALVVGVLSLGTASDAAALYQYLVGSLLDRRWHQVRIALPAMLVGAVFLIGCAGPINTLRLGDAAAAGVGAHPARIRIIVLGAAALATAGVVSAAGPIGFVALAVPHAVRRILRDSDVRHTIVASALGGAVALVGTDIAARLIVAPRELPVGLLTVFLGVPIAMWVGRRRTTGVGE